MTRSQWVMSTFGLLIAVVLAAYIFMMPPFPERWKGLKLGMSVYDPYFLANWVPVFDQGKLKPSITPRFADAEHWKINNNRLRLSIEFNATWEVTSIRIEKEYKGIFAWLYYRLIHW